VAERHGRITTVYLLPGLTKPERRSALRRLRLSARMGHCPRLPSGSLALALFADRIRTGIGRTGAVLRLHPAGSTLPVMVLSGGAIAFLLFSTVSIRVMHSSPASPESASGPNPAASAGAIPITGSSGGVAGLGGSSLATGPSLAGAPGGPGNGQGAGAAPGGGGNGTGPGGSGTSGSTGSGTGASGGTTLSGGSDPTPASSQGGASSGGGSSSSSSPSQPASSSSSAPQPAPSATQPASSGVCLHVGPLGVCLNV
jgi:hypothetical protein